MNHTIVILPLLIPLATSLVCMLLWQKRFWKKVACITGNVLLVIASGILCWEVAEHSILVSAMGNWKAPFGIVLVVDHLSAMMVMITAIIGLSAGIFSLKSIVREETKAFYPLFHILLMGVNGAFMTGDLFNLYVWFEIMLISSFVLLSLGLSKDCLQAAVKYVTLNLLSSVIFLAAVGILYGQLGTLNMADLALKIEQVEESGLVVTVATMFLVAFGIKAALFPFFFWLPSSYHTPHPVTSAIFAALLTKVGVYSLLRTFTLIFTQEAEYFQMIFLWIAGLTMLTGVWGAMIQNDIRRILSFHIISQIGYMIMGLAIATPLAIAGAIFYIVHHIIVKANLFFIAGVIKEEEGSLNLEEISGLHRHYPIISLVFIISAFSLAGFPPLSGFFAKFLLLKASISASYYVITGVAVFVSIFTLYSMTKIWVKAFWGKAKKEKQSMVKPASTWMLRATFILAAITLVIGLQAEFLYRYSEATAEQILNKNFYIQAVMEEAK